jgi:hypothetical protein
MIKFYEVIFILLAKLNGVGMIVCRMNRTAIAGVKIDSNGNEGIFSSKIVPVEIIVIPMELPVEIVVFPMEGLNQQIYILISSISNCREFQKVAFRNDVSKNCASKLLCSGLVVCLDCF